MSQTEHLFDTGRMGDRVELTEAAAVELTELMSAGGIDAVRLVPDLPAEARTWTDAGTLDVWVRDKGRWYGRVVDADGLVQLIPAEELRPV